MKNKDEIIIIENSAPDIDDIKIISDGEIDNTIFQSIKISEKDPLLDEIDIEIEGRSFKEYDEEELVTIVMDHTDNILNAINITEDAINIEIDELKQPFETNLTELKINIDRFKSVYNQLENEYTKLLAILNSLSPNNPLYNTLKNRLNEIKTAIEDVNKSIIQLEQQLLQSEETISIDKKDLKNEEFTIEIENNSKFFKPDTTSITDFLANFDKLKTQTILLDENLKQKTKVIINQKALDKMKEYGKTSKLEVGGVLIGQTDKANNQIIITDFIAVEGESESSKFKFRSQDWKEVLKEIDQTNENTSLNQEMVGWFHTHPGFGTFLSSYDTFIASEYFTANNHLSIVFDSKQDQITIWKNKNRETQTNDYEKDTAINTVFHLPPDEDTKHHTYLVPVNNIEIKSSNRISEESNRRSLNNGVRKDQQISSSTRLSQKEENNGNRNEDPLDIGYSEETTLEFEEDPD